MSKLYQLPESEKDRIRNLHSVESKDIRINSKLNEAVDSSLDAPSELKAKMSQMSDAGDYHMWENCAGGQVVALTDDQTMTANGQSCHNAANQNPTNPGIVLACTQALVNQYGTGPVIQWGTNQSAVKSCWKYLGTQFFNNVPSTASPNQGGTGGGGGATTLQSCSQCSTNSGGDLAWICADVGGGQGGTGCQQMTCPYGNQATNPAAWNVGGGCWANQQDCNNGGLNAASGSNNPCGGYGGTEHECTPNGCVPWAGGQYPDLNTCQTNCPAGGTNYCIDCYNQQMTYYPNPNQPGMTSCPPGYVDLGTQSPPQPACYECDGNGNCNGPNWTGTYNTPLDCQNGTSTQPACTPAPGWDCVSNACIQTPTGPYPTQAICQAQTNCGANYPKYKCSGGAQGCVQSNNGQYTGPTALADCETACCQNSLSNWNWNALPNPTCAQLNAKFNTPALQAIGDCSGNLTPGPHNFNHKCRYDWMVAQAAAGNCCGNISDVCCDNPGYLSATLTPIPGPSSGKCLKQGFINNKEAGYQQYGCPWLQNVMNTLNTNIANATSNSVLCSLHGRKSWLTTFMNGGNAYNASIVVNPPC
jgi:hypothetical protein